MQLFNLAEDLGETNNLQAEQPERVVALTELLNHYAENDAIMEKRYKKLGGSIEVIIENKGHTHGMKDPTPVLEFIKANTAQ